jgi:glycosyltransferase involved in cell wall biosynthesis
MSLAMRAAGYQTLTVVREVYGINEPSDFDRTADSMLGDRMSARRRRWIDRLGLTDYAVFSTLLDEGDIFHFFFDGGFLGRTPLRYLEVRLLHLAGKKVIVMPYGSDAAIPSETMSAGWRTGLLAHYPALGRTEARTRRRIRHFCSVADYVVTGLVHFETLPRWDLLTIQYYPIDTAAWAPAENSPEAGDPADSVVVVHAPNHRELKGTQALVDACASLQREGQALSLRLIENVPNTVVRSEMQSADVIAEQFILGYGLTAIEGMSLGKPVLSNLSDPRYYDLFREVTRLGECPIVSTSPEDLADTLRRLVGDPDLRRRIGSASRRYALREHSYEAMARLWTAVYDRVWWGSDRDPADLLRPDANQPDSRAPAVPRI